MPSTIGSASPTFSWFSPQCRPSRDEVETYARLIAAREGVPVSKAATFKREAELQLWVWRTENDEPPPPRHRPRKAA